jgi:hypothetical protein
MWLLFCKQAILTERPQLVGEVRVNLICYLLVIHYHFPIPFQNNQITGILLANCLIKQPETAQFS